MLVLAASYFFFLMMGYYLLRPLREAMGIAEGADKLPWLMTATMAAMFLANPVFSALVSRLPRRRFIPLTYRFFALNMLAFFALFSLLPAHGGTVLGYIFYVWLSVYNLFVVSVFWAFMADIFNEEQGKRLFAMISIGGSLGAIAGAALTGAISRGSLFGLSVHAEPGTLILVAVVFLEAAVQCVYALARRFRLSDRPGGPREPGPDVFEGLRLIVASRFLALICAYILLFTVTSTFLYIEQGRIVAHAFPNRAAKTEAFAWIDLWTNVLTLASQLFLTQRLIKIFGLRRCWRFCRQFRSCLSLRFGVGRPSRCWRSSRYCAAACTMPSIVPSAKSSTSPWDPARSINRSPSSTRSSTAAAICSAPGPPIVFCCSNSRSAPLPLPSPPSGSTQPCCSARSRSEWNAATGSENRRKWSGVLVPPLPCLTPSPTPIIRRLSSTAQG